ncbi:MAG: S9 family peptidase [Acidimicrobiales bacterium]|nr:S9 family peptidase [Acidimicrobiales bacterium]
MAELIELPPAARREPVVDTWHGVAVADPYRWLENGDDPEVVDWVAAQNAHTRQALDARPSRGQWHERLSALVGLPTVLSCAVRGERLFVLERAAHADQFALVMRDASDPVAPGRVLLDPAGLAADAAVAIDWYEPNDDGTTIAVGLSEGGTEESTLRVLDVATATLGDLAIGRTRACSVAWHPDGGGFWYTRYPDGDSYHRHVRFHRLGDDPATDAVVFGPDRLPTPETWPDVAVSPDGAHVLVTLMVGWGRYEVVLHDVVADTWRTVVDGVDGVNEFRFGGDGLIGRTTVDAPNGRIVTVGLDEPTPPHWRTVVPERPDLVLGAFARTGARLAVAVGRAAVDTIERWSLDGRSIDHVDALGVVSVAQLEAVDPDDDTSAVFATVSSFAEPTAVWRIRDTPEVAGAQVARWCPAPPDGGALPALTVSHTTYSSLDGTDVGLFLIHRTDVVPGPGVPAVLNGYGGFAISESPVWMPNVAAWCAEGGVWAIAGLRGGLEHGEAWHRAGRREHKQHVFDDFHAAADWLVATGRAHRDRLALAGGSNGGLLVGAALTQRPDLARVVWCAVPLLDMVRFPQFLIARLWTDEYGDPDVAEEFGWLHAYSPYHHVVAGTRYPAVLFTTAEGDQRVDPLHARKMAAMLQHAVAGDPDVAERPVLLWQAGRAGHGVGKPASMRVAEGVDVLSFLWWQLGAEASDTRRQGAD